MSTRVKTVPVRVKLYTDQFVVSGLLHTKPGGYKDRVSDLVNDPGARFLAVTDVTFRPVGDEGSPAKHCNTMIVRLEEINLLIPFEEVDDAPRVAGTDLGAW